MRPGDETIRRIPALTVNTFSQRRPMLIVVRSPHAVEVGRTVALGASGATTIGRAPASSLRLNDTGVSRLHATFEVRGATVTVVDGGSSNGTYVNGLRVSSVELMHGDRVEVGSTVIRFDGGQGRDAWEWLQQAVAGSGVALWEFLAARSELLFSEHADQVLRLPATTLSRQRVPLEGLVHPEDLPGVLEAFTRPETPAFEKQFRIRPTPNDERWVLCLGQRADDGSMAGTIVDVSDRKRLESQVELLDRLSSLGTLSAGVAHEINNPLAYVLTNVEFALDCLVETGAPEVVEALREAKEGALRVAGIVRDLRAFSTTEQPQEPGQVELGAVVDSAVKMTEKHVTSRATLRVSVEDEVRVTAHGARLEQVLMNLLINAADSIPDGSRGEVTITAGSQGADLVSVEVHDTGVGMSAEVLERAFDPFFSTKPVGKGTGLGLSICHGLVTRMGGRIELESEVGQGTTARVLLARAPAERVPERTALNPVPTEAPMRARVLLIDDEPMVHRAMGRLLRNHELSVASGVRSGLQAVESSAGFDLILCDVMMGDGTGMDFFEQLKARWPALAPRVVFITGGAFTERATRFLQQVPNQTLLKPVDAMALHRLIADFQALAGEGAELAPAEPRPPEGVAGHRVAS